MSQEKEDQWWADADFWRNFHPIMYDRERLNRSLEDVNGVLNLSESTGELDILDLACGTGRHSKIFALQGHRVTGVDIHREVLEVAKLESEALEPKPRFIQEDIRNYKESDAYDGVVSLFQSFGYFEDPRDDLKVCRNVCDSLRSGGWFLIESDGKELASRLLGENTWFERDGRLILLEYSVERSWTHLRNHWLFRDIDGSWKERVFSYRLYSALEMGHLLEESGFAEIQFFGGFDGRPYDGDADRLVALAKKA